MSGARSVKPRKGARPPRGESVLVPHLRALRESLSHMRANGGATAMSVAVMAIAVALPAMMYALVANQHAWFEQWGGEPSLTVFLRRDVETAPARRLAERLRADPRVGDVELVHRDEAFAEFARTSGLAGVVAGGVNPLPHVLIVTPHPDAWAYDRGAALVASLEGMAPVDSVLVDFAWVERLQAIGALGERAVVVLAVLLAGGALLIVGNTVRVLVHQRHDEIELLKLVGATDAFVRRPFLYGGTLHGLAAGVLAAALVQGVFLALSTPFSRVARAYLGDFSLHGLGVAQLGALVALSAALGWCGAWVGIGLSLRRIDAGPS